MANIMTHRRMGMKPRKRQARSLAATPGRLGLGASPGRRSSPRELAPYPNVSLRCRSPTRLNQHEFDQALERDLRRDTDAPGERDELLPGSARHLRPREPCVRLAKRDCAERSKAAPSSGRRHPQAEPLVDRSGSLACRLRGRGLKGS